MLAQVFLQRSAVNLLSTVMDTPEFFWSAPDHLQVHSKEAHMVIHIFLFITASRPCCYQYVHMRHEPQRISFCCSDAYFLPLQVLYKRVCEYLELDTRVEVWWQ